MIRRGQLIRTDIPSIIRSFAEDIRAAMAIPALTIEVVGRDGTGRKTEIPWVQFFSPAHSPRPTEGWYVVLLFHAKGEGLYLALVHGSTTWENGEFRPRAASEVEVLLTWARATLGSEMSDHLSILKRIDLGSGRELAKAYERSTLAALWYPVVDLPNIERLKEDCLTFARLLGLLYEAVDYGRVPGSVSPDVAAAVSIMKDIAKGRRSRDGGGQGFGLSANERQAVECHAMAIAQEYLLKRGYTVEDVSKRESFDLLARDASGEMTVEVKGTTAGPNQILLTANEVEVHRTRYPSNMLIVVHGIELDRRSAAPKATGGAILAISPWGINLGVLKPLSFQYTLEPALQKP